MCIFNGEDISLLQLNGALRVNQARGEVAFAASFQNIQSPLSGTWRLGLHRVGTRHRHTVSCTQRINSLHFGGVISTWEDICAIPFSWSFKTSELKVVPTRTDQLCTVGNIKERSNTLRGVRAALAHFLRTSAQTEQGNILRYTTVRFSVSVFYICNYGQIWGVITDKKNACACRGQVSADACSISYIVTGLQVVSVENMALLSSSLGWSDWWKPASDSFRHQKKGLV